MKIRPVGAKLFHSDILTEGQTDMTEANSSFSQFCEKRLKMYDLTTKVRIVTYILVFIRYLG